MIWTNSFRWKNRNLHILLPLPQPRGAFLQEGEGEEKGFGLYLCPVSKKWFFISGADPVKVRDNIEAYILFVWCDLFQ